jgi:hypothetical protein
VATYPTLPPNTTLQAIQTKVRRLTQSPSEAQLTTDDLNNYINTAVVYDFPEHLRTFNLRTTFTFYTNPYQDEYFTNISGYGNPNVNPSIANNPLYNFQNKYISVHPPAYIAGYQALYTQSPEQFFNIYPKINFIQFTGTNGDGVTTTFSGVINSQQANLPNNFNQQIALLQRQVLFDSADTNLNGLSLVDVPVLNTSNGNSTVVGNLYDPNSAAYQAALTNPPTTVLANNNINYATGAYTITFSAAPGANIPINSQSVPQVIALPQALMFYANKFVVRPVPDQVYRINFEVYQMPTQLFQTNSVPALNEYWQFIAYMAAKKIFEDRMDIDSVQMILPEFRNQMNLCNRRTIVQYTNERTATIYTEQTAITTGGWTGWGNNT